MNENIEGLYPEYVFDNIRIARANRTKCIVCGHPTGDCSTSSSTPNHIIGQGIFKSVDEKLEFVVDKDVYEQRQINPHYTAKVLIVRKGQKISVTKAKELGLL